MLYLSSGLKLSSKLSCTAVILFYRENDAKKAIEHATFCIFTIDNRPPTVRSRGTSRWCFLVGVAEHVLASVTFLKLSSRSFTFSY